MRNPGSFPGRLASVLRVALIYASAAFVAFLVGIAWAMPHAPQLIRGLYANIFRVGVLPKSPVGVLVNLQNLYVMARAVPFWTLLSASTLVLCGVALYRLRRLAGSPEFGLGVATFTTLALGIVVAAKYGIGLHLGVALRFYLPAAIALHSGSRGLRCWQRANRPRRPGASPLQ